MLPAACVSLCASTCALFDERELRAQVSRQVWQLAQDLPWSCVPTINPPVFAFGVHSDFRHPAGPMEVQIRMEVLLVKLLDRLRVFGRNMAVPHVLSDHRAVFGLRQAIVVGVPRPRFGLLHQQLVQ